MDWRMPGLDGIETTRLLKKEPELKTHPAVVLVTAFGRDEVREEAERCADGGGYCSITPEHLDVSAL